MILIIPDQRCKISKHVKAMEFFSKNLILFFRWGDRNWNFKKNENIFNAFFSVFSNSLKLLKNNNNKYFP